MAKGGRRREGDPLAGVFLHDCSFHAYTIHLWFQSSWTPEHMALTNGSRARGEKDGGSRLDRNGIESQLCPQAPWSRQVSGPQPSVERNKVMGIP